LLSDRYRIESEIDTGGMATVYRARDLKHDRTVAIKVLRPDLAEAIGADRFLREIRTTANLSHPHILPLFDSGEADGFLYYVMPFVEGGSLQDRLDREGELPVEEAVEIAREVADALAYAHGKGVIHRDIKPANIMLEGGHALLADFGIAQAKAGAEVTKLTESGMSLGTPSYMSPEQISGDKALDGRADQYALGCVLYEMLAGHPPFAGTGVETVLRQHLAVDAPRVTGARPTVPKGVADAVHRALAKSPADRYRTVSEFEKALAGATLPLLARIPMGRARTLAYSAVALVVLVGVWDAWTWISGVERGGEAASDGASGSDLVPNRVLVTVFENDTDDPALDRVGVEATDYIIQGLGRLGVGLVEVVPLETARALKVPAGSMGRGEGAAGTGLGCPLAAGEGAGVLISGNVFAQGDSLRITGQILDVKACRVLWRLDPVTVSAGEPTPGFIKLSGRAAGAVASHLDPQGSWLEGGRPPPPSFEVYLEYSAALGASRYETKVEHLHRALALDSTYLSPRLYLSVEHYLNGDYSLADSQATIAEGFRDRGTPGEQAELDYYQAGSRGDREGAYLHSKRTADLTGTSFDLANHAHEAKQTNRPREVIEALSSLDPDDPDLSHFYWSDLSESHHMLGEFEEALSAAREGQARFPEAKDLVIHEARALAALGRTEEVLLIADEVERRWWPSEDLTLVGGFLLSYGQDEAADRVFRRVVTLVEELPEDRRESFRGWVTRGDALLLAGRTDEAREFLEKAAAVEPRIPGALVSLGVAAARRGDTRAAHSFADRIQEVDFPYDFGRKEYYRAWIAAALGDSVEAVELLREAFADGWSFDANLHAAPWLDPLRGYGPFEEWLRPKG